MHHDGDQGGRPSKLTAEIRAKCIQAFSLGLNMSQVAAYCRLHPDTIRNWVRDNEDGLKDDLEHGLGEKLVEVLEKIHAGHPGSTGLKWWLERLLPEQWSVNEIHKYEALADRTKATLTNGRT